MMRNVSESGEPEISSDEVRNLMDQCKNYRFSPYSPYRSFCSEERLLIGPKGIIIDSMLSAEYDEGLNSDGHALWSIGKAAFDALKVAGPVDFFRRYKSYLDLISTVRLSLAEGLLTKISLVDQYDCPVSVDDFDLDEQPSSQILSVLFQLVDKLQKFAFAPAYQAELLCFACLEEIANAIIGHELGGDGAISASLAAANCLADAQALDPTAARSKEVRRRLATLAASKRHASDPRQTEKIFIRDCYDSWASEPSRYKSTAAFAQDMLGKCEHLKSARKIEDWVREWRKSKARNPPEDSPSP